MRERSGFDLNIRIKFQKSGVMKFIGHLDMMRYFQKAIRRAGIDIAYSEGYSPHQLMSFAAPLGVGLTSSGEYFDIQVNSSQSSTASIEALNRVMVEGVSILEYKRLPDTAKPSMSLVAAADYLIGTKPGYQPLFQTYEEYKERMLEFYAQPHIWMTKQTKKSQVELDLKRFLYHVEVLDGNGAYGFSEPYNGNLLFLQVCTGSSDNIKPELALEAFCKFCGMDYQPLAYQIHRLEVYAKSDEIPVKGEAERKAYQKYLDSWKASFQAKGERFPRFLALGDLGEEIQ